MAQNTSNYKYFDVESEWRKELDIKTKLEIMTH